MTLNVAQSATYESGRRWTWSVWLTGTHAELDDVKKVFWVLHPTFPDPVKEIADRASGFKLNAKGWGEFQIRVRVVHRDGNVTELVHDLELSGDTTRSPRKEPVVFMSYSSADAEAAHQLQKDLRENGIDARDAADVAEAGKLWEDQLSQTIQTSDAVIAVTSDLTSAWVDREVSVAKSMGVPVVPVTIGAAGAAESGDFNAIEFDPSDSGSSATSISEFVFEARDRGRSSRPPS